MTTRWIDIDDLVGAGEIADRLGTKKNTVVNWTNRFDDFPKPVVSHLKMGRIWSWRAVAAWYHAHPWTSRHTGHFPQMR